MKKMIFALIVAAVAMPALAHEDKAPQLGQDVPAMEMQRDHEAFKKAREEQKAQLKATKEKMEKLVKEYNKLKPGKKKDAKRDEIEQELRAIHEKRLEFKKGQLAQFEERLARMKAEFEKENSAEGRADWVQQKTDALIAAQGDLSAVFEPRPGVHRPPLGPRGKDGQGPHRKFMGKGPRAQRPDIDD